MFGFPWTYCGSGGSLMACLYIYVGREVYGDEDPGIPLQAQLVQKMPRNDETKALFSCWGLGSDSSPSEVSKKFDRASQPVWYLASGEGGTRIEGLALFPFSGTLRHAPDPALALTYVQTVA